MAVQRFDGITYSSPQQKEDETEGKEYVKDSHSPCSLLHSPAVISLFFALTVVVERAMESANWVSVASSYRLQYQSVHYFGQDKTRWLSC